jgi:hypothetical protein
MAHECADSPANAARQRYRDVSQKIWFADIKMLFWRFVDKMDGK